MLEVTIIGSHSHVDSQALGEVHHRLVDVFLWQLFPDGLQGDFQLISVRLEFTFPAWCADVVIQRIQIWKRWGHSFSQ